MAGYHGTQAEFCTQQGITLSSLRYHLARNNPVCGLGEENSSETFVAVGTLGHERENHSAIQLMVGGIRVLVRPSTDMNFLGQVLKVAVQACGRT